MRSLRVLPLLVCVVLAASTGPAAATDFFVYPAKVKIVAKMTVIGATSDTIAVRKLGNNDIINLALGRAPGTKVDAKREVLAVAGTYLDHANESTLIVFDPSQNGLQQIVTTVGTVATFDADTAGFPSKTQVFGVGSMTLEATTLGAPSSFGFLTSTMNVNGEGSGTHDPFGTGSSKVSAKGNFAGRLRFNDASKTPPAFDGIVVKAEAKGSGKAIGGVTK